MARVTNAELAKQVEDLSAKLAERDEQVTLLVEAYQNSQAEVKAAKKAKKKGVKNGRVIRNATLAVFHDRIGDPEKPFRIELQPRGQRGDTTTVPVSLLDDPGYQRNLKLGVIEEITLEDAGAIDYGRATGPVAELRSTVVRPEETVVSRRDPNNPQKELRTGDVGPRVSDQFAGAASYAGAGQQVDPEYAQFLAWKAAGGGAVAQSGVPAADPVVQRQAPQDEVIQKLVADGLIPEGELSKPVRVERMGGPSTAPQGI